MPMERGNKKIDDINYIELGFPIELGYEIWLVKKGGRKEITLFHQIIEFQKKNDFKVLIASFMESIQLMKCVWIAYLLSTTERTKFSALQLIVFVKPFFCCSLESATVCVKK